LRQIYLEQKGVDPNKDTIAYCRIGERSSHTWFVLTYLLGLKKVRNYDGSLDRVWKLVGGTDRERITSPGLSAQIA
jgi:thiosulfate/3-mercaptopyruvate sulfurtransferase